MRAVVVTLAALVVPAIPAEVAAAEDPRIPVALPAEMREPFLEHMRQHMDSFDDVMAQLAAGDFKGAAAVARSQLVPGSGAGFGRHLPVSFREMGLAMHRAAATFADVADGMPAQPTAGDWQSAMAALHGISVQCRACHATFRLQ